jgi:hypothetical protein
MKQCGMLLRFVDNQTDEICLAAVKQNGLALEFVKKQTYETCLEAINNNFKAFKYVRTRDPELYRIGLEKYGDKITPYIDTSILEE